MTMNEFISACASRTIDPAIALEDLRIIAALKGREDEEVRRLLDEEF